MRLRCGLSFAIALMLGSCSGFEPTAETLVGTYAATTLETATDGRRTDWLARGGSLELTLLGDGHTTGRLAYGDPASPSTVIYGLSGEWTLLGRQVALHLAGFADLTLEAKSADRLAGSYTQSVYGLPEETLTLDLRRTQ